MFPHNQSNSFIPFPSKVHLSMLILRVSMLFTAISAYLKSFQSSIKLSLNATGYKLSYLWIPTSTLTTSITFFLSYVYWYIACFSWGKNLLSISSMILTQISNIYKVFNKTILNELFLGFKTSYAQVGTSVFHTVPEPPVPRVYTMNN